MKPFETTINDAPFHLAMSEKIATIVRNQSCGALGNYVPLDPVECHMPADLRELARVEVFADQYEPQRKVFIVSRGPHGYTLRAKHFHGIDHDIETAARFALSQDDGSNVGPLRWD